MSTERRLQAKKWASDAMADRSAIVLAMEHVVSRGALEVVEIAAIRPQGSALFNQLIRPSGTYRDKSVRSISKAMLAAAPTFDRLIERVELMLIGATSVIVYNAPLAREVLQSSAQIYGQDFAPCMQIDWVCLMKLDAIARTGSAENVKGLAYSNRALNKCKASLKLFEGISLLGIQETLF